MPEQPTDTRESINEIKEIISRDLKSRIEGLRFIKPGTVSWSQDFVPYAQWVTPVEVTTADEIGIIDSMADTARDLLTEKGFNYSKSDFDNIPNDYESEPHRVDRFLDIKDSKDNKICTIMLGYCITTFPDDRLGGQIKIVVFPAKS